MNFGARQFGPMMRMVASSAASLEASGCLQPAWSWGDLWPEAWAQAQREWSGVLTLNALKTLHEFGYLQ